MKDVKLPTGKSVQISETPLPWWSKDHRTGFVSPTMLAPDPNQPRKHIRSEELVSLEESIAEQGVREPITVTPRHLAPWVTLDPEYENAYFVTVSGHRRNRSALKKSVQAVPIRVRIYADEKAHRLDAALLNENRSSLTPIEQAWEMQRLRDSGYTLKKLQAAFGVSSLTVYARLSLTKLCPEIQKMLDPELPRKKRVGLKTASTLGEVKAPTVEELEEFLDKFRKVLKTNPYFEHLLPDMLDEDDRRFAFQHILLTIVRERGMSAARAQELIYEHAHVILAEKKHGTKRHRNVVARFQPKKRREVLSNLPQPILGSVVVDWKPQDFDLAFGNQDWEDADEILKKFDESIQFLTIVRNRIEKIRDSKPHRSKYVLEAEKRKKAQAG